MVKLSDFSLVFQLIESDLVDVCGPPTAFPATGGRRIGHASRDASQSSSEPSSTPSNNGVLR